MQDRRTETNPKGRYTIFSPHLSLPKEKDVMTYITFDPGEYTFDVRVERRTRGVDCCLLVETVEQNKHRVNCQREAVKGTGTASFFFSSVTSILEEYRKHLSDLDIVIVERQMEVHTGMMVLQTTIVSYFLLCYPGVFVVDISPRLKGDHLGAPAVHDYKQLKAWGVGRALALAEKRGDALFLSYIDSQRKGKKSQWKLDDDTDNYMQAEAFCAEVGYQLTGVGRNAYVGPARLVPTSVPAVKKPRKKPVKKASEEEELSESDWW